MMRVVATSMFRSFARRSGLIQFSTSPSFTEPPIPVYKAKDNETSDQLRARLVYQSRKRGTLENGLLLSTFADKYLADMNDAAMKQYDHLINTPSSDWDIYYWATGKADVPEEYKSPLMDKLLEHTKNRNMEVRLRQPDLKFKDP